MKEIADGVTSRWQGLVTRAEERHKLVTASLNFYKTAEQVGNLVFFMAIVRKHDAMNFDEKSIMYQMEYEVTIPGWNFNLHNQQWTCPAICLIFQKIRFQKYFYFKGSSIEVY